MAPVNKEELRPESVTALQDTIDCDEFCVGRPRFSSAWAIRDLGIWQPVLDVPVKSAPMLWNVPTREQSSDVSNGSQDDRIVSAACANVDEPLQCWRQEGSMGGLHPCALIARPGDVGPQPFCATAGKVQFLLTNQSCTPFFLSKHRRVVTRHNIRLASWYRPSTDWSEWKSQ